jgi:hypothetical protein
MAAREERNQQALNHNVLADDNLTDLFANIPDELD